MYYLPFKKILLIFTALVTASSKLATQSVVSVIVYHHLSQPALKSLLLCSCDRKSMKEEEEENRVGRRKTLCTFT